MSSICQKKVCYCFYFDVEKMHNAKVVYQKILILDIKWVLEMLKIFQMMLFWL